MEDEKPVIYLYNLNPVNYTNLNWRYDYYAMSQGLGMGEVAKKIFGIDVEKPQNPIEFIVKKYYLPDRNIAWLISSNMFKHYYAFLLNPITHDEVVVRNGITYYTNICIKCGTKTTAMQPLPKISYAGYENAVYLCNKCHNIIVKAIPKLESIRKNAKRTDLEDRIAEILNSIGIKYEQEKVFNLDIFNKVVDFYIPCGKLIIEGNGLAHHSTASESKFHSRYGRQAFFVNVMKDILSAYELTHRGYYVYIITEADFRDFDKFVGSEASIAPAKINSAKVRFLKEDLEQILSLRGCNIKPNIIHIKPFDTNKIINFNNP